MDEQKASKIIIRFAEKYVFGYDEDEDGYGKCSCGRGYNTNTGLYFQNEEDDYWCLRCRDENLDEDDRHDVCGECYDRSCVNFWCLKKDDPEEFFTEQIKDKFKKFFEERWKEDDYTSKIEEHKEEFGDTEPEGLEDLKDNYCVDFKDDFLHEVYKDEKPVPYDETSAKFFIEYINGSADDIWDEKGMEESEAGLYMFVNDVLCEFNLEDYRE